MLSLEAKKAVLKKGALDEEWIRFNQEKVQGVEGWGRESRNQQG